MKRHPLFLLLVAACGTPPAPTASNPGLVETAKPAVNVASSGVGESPYVPKPVRFENPGGMWMPNQMPAHATKLRELGLQLDPAVLADPTSNLLQSIVSLGGCSASFVSSEGLVITNHHCATGALQLNSTAAKDVAHDGFIAKTRLDEVSAGPTFRVFVTQKVTDVTKQVFDRTVAQRTTDQARFKMIEKNQKDVLSACEKDRPGVRCSVSSFYEGAQFYLIEQLELRDIRLVYAPAEGVGNYGGEIDNWRWPRHSGDVSIFRAYVSKEGKPADYATDNVPYKPPHYLKPASKGLEESELVMIAGYPGRTHTLKTRAEADEFISFRYPRGQKLAEDILQTLSGLTEKEATIRARPFVRRYGNSLTNIKGQLDGLIKDGLLAKKTEHENALIAWVNGAPERKTKYGPVFEEIAKAYDKQKQFRESDAELRSEFLLPRLVGAAYSIVRMAEERPKPDRDRDPDYQERNWPRITQSLEALEKQYHRQVDIALLTLAISRRELVDVKARANVDALLVPHVPKGVGKEAAPGVAAAHLYAGTTLEDPKVRMELLKTATTAQLANSKDALMQFAFKLRPLLKAADDRDQAFAGRMALLKPATFDALREFEKREIAPDANGTLRVTYGTVRGYRPSKDKDLYRPFTLLPELIAKHTGKEPFDVPKNLIKAYEAKRFGGYVDGRWGAVPVNFLSDLHITGGNSGSATLNAKGEITGLAFDGNYESLASDWLFKPEVTRTIHVDIRYVYWLLDAVDGGAHILREMGVQGSTSAAH
jgi:hypothetical protein